MIGLGCGTGVKEEWLARSLKRQGSGIQKFTAVDVSDELCRMSMGRVNPYLAQDSQAWVMDLDASLSLRKSIDTEGQKECRLFTFFGLVPNLTPESILRIWKSLLRPGDHLLVSANLAPVQKADETDVDESIQQVLPQYRNPETRRWLGILFREQGISSQWISSLHFGIENQKGVRSILVRTTILQNFEWTLGLRKLKFKKGDSLNVFQSRRWTPKAFEAWILKNGFKVRGSQITPNREEGVWWVEK